MSNIRLYMLAAGTLRCKVHNIKLNQGLNEPYEIPVPWFLITHPRGNVVIDGGTPVECATDPRGYWGNIVDVYWPVIQEQEGCLNQLRRLAEFFSIATWRLLRVIGSRGACGTQHD